MAHRLTVRAPDQTPNGDASTGWSRLVYRQALNAPGGWSLTLPASHPATELLLIPGAGLAIEDDAGNVFGGPVAPATGDRAAFERVTTATTDLVTVTGVDDLACLWWRQAVPPAGSSHSVHTGPVGIAVTSLVDAHLGDTAATDRAFPGWQTDTTATTTETATIRGRYRPVGDLAAAVCNDHGLVMAATWSPGRVLFTVADPAAPSYPLSVEAGTATTVTRQDETGAATFVYGLGQGEGADRAVSTAGAPSSPGTRIELALDRRDIDNDTDLAAAAAAAVSSPERTVVVESAYAPLRVGDTGIARIDGVDVSLVVAEVRHDTTGDRTRRTITLGTPPRSAVDRIIDAARRTITAT